MKKGRGEEERGAIMHHVPNLCIHPDTYLLKRLFKKKTQEKRRLCQALNVIKTKEVISKKKQRDSHQHPPPHSPTPHTRKHKQRSSTTERANRLSSGKEGGG